MSVKALFDVSERENNISLALLVFFEISTIFLG